MNLQTQFDHILTLITTARNKAIYAANTEQIVLYWEIGRFISKKLDDSEWGDGAVLELSQYLQSKDPSLTNFTKRGLYRMRQFHLAYPDFEIVSALPTQLSWTHNLEILSQAKTIEERKFYLELCLKEKLNYRELRRQLKSNYFERSLLANKLLPASLENYPRDVSNVFKDSYVFEFVNLPPKHSEKDLQKALLEQLKFLILELGKDFVFMAEEYRLQVGMKDFKVDLLFYHRELCCLVAFDLKMEDFEPSFLGQMNFYLEALDTDIKKPHENPSIGVLVCRSKDHEVVEYALRRNLSPTLVADYTTKLIDKNLLSQKINELFDLYDNDIENGESKI
jgi:predicted nuclease of restriction endonuclease-like (RecB) superfamily